MSIYGEVPPGEERIAILGMGPSIGDLDLDELREAQERDGVEVIAVNGAIELFPAADYWFSLDPSRENEERIRNPVPGTRYFVALPKKGMARRRWMAENATILRRIVRSEPKRGPFSLRVLYQIVGGLSRDPDRIHTGNSGFGALGVAFLMGAKKIALFGIDGRGRTRYDGTRNGYLGHLPRLFESAVEDLDEEGVEVRVGSPESTVDCFLRRPAPKVLSWLKR